MKITSTLSIDKNWRFGFLSATALYLIIFGLYNLLQPAKNYHTLRLIDKSIKHANEIIDWGSRSLIESMQYELDRTPDLKPIADAAASAPSEIRGLLEKINGIRVRIAEESGGLYILKEHQSKWKGYGYKKFVITTDSTKDGTAVGFDNKSVVQRILIGEKAGDSLKAEIIKTRAALSAIVEKLNDRLEKEQIQGVRFDHKAIEALKKELVLELPKNLRYAKNDKSFTELAFGNLSVAEANLMLRKFQIDAKVSCTQVINYLASNMSSGRIKYSDFEIFSQPTKNAIYLGETYESKIALGKFSRQLEFSVNVNGSDLPVYGIATTYSAKPNSVGTQHYIATINLKNPETGRMERIRKEFQYEVLAPKQKY